VTVLLYGTQCTPAMESLGDAVSADPLSSPDDDSAPSPSLPAEVYNDDTTAPAEQNTVHHTVCEIPVPASEHAGDGAPESCTHAAIGAVHDLRLDSHQDQLNSHETRIARIEPVLKVVDSKDMLPQASYDNTPSTLPKRKPRRPRSPSYFLSHFM
jgi:hypothetical protein